MQPCVIPSSKPTVPQTQDQNTWQQTALLSHRDDLIEFKGDNVVPPPQTFRKHPFDCATASSDPIFSPRPYPSHCPCFAFMWKNIKEFKDKHVSKLGSDSSSAPQKNDQDLTTILDRSQRADLTVLVAEITQSMRDVIEKNYHNHTSEPDQFPPEKETEDPPRSSFDSQEESNEENKPAFVKLSANDLRDEASTLSSFDDWREAVLLRIGEVVNREEEGHEGEGSPERSEVPPESQPQLDEDERSIQKLHEVYPPVQTPLARLDKAKKLLILHSLLLLMLSLEHYNARSRVLMLYVTSSLNLDVKILNGDEVTVARGLLDTALQLSGSDDGQGQKEKSDTARKWKVGIASVTGAVLIGVTGGLAAPLVAAGLGTVLGGLGLGATAAAGYLGALAGSGVIVGSLFGAYGGRMTGRAMDKYAREVDDFAFLPIRGSQHRSEDEKEAAQEDHRLRVTIGVTGWLTEEDNFVVPWRVIGADSEVFGLRWETEPLMNLGNAMDLLVTSAAFAAGSQVLKKTIFASLLNAVVLPLGLLKVTKVADNPFSVAKARSDKAGEVLADALISKVQGERSVTLIGYSLGSRVIFSCLQSLAKRRAYGLVESVVLMGSATPSNTEHWRRMRSVVSGRIVNVYSDNDTVLALLYRTSSFQMGVAGLQPVRGVPGVENLDVSDIISGHLRYQFMVGHILTRVGLESIDRREVIREEVALEAKDRRQEQERIRNKRRAGIDENPDEDSARRVLESDQGAEEDARLQSQLQARTNDQLPPKLPRRPTGPEEEERPKLPLRPSIPRRPVPDGSQ